MPVSLKNRRNTRIEVSDDKQTVKLFHHGSNTCTIEHLRGVITINTYGYDTVTTRGKINLFLDKYAPRTCALVRRKGITYLARWSNLDDWHDRSLQTEFRGSDYVLIV